MNILIACEESQRVCTAFRQKGHRAFSCDIQKCSGGHPEWHIKGDVLSLLNPGILLCSTENDIDDEMIGSFKTQDGEKHALPPKWDLLIAHPPCTYLSNAGARWLYKGGRLNYERYEKGIAAKEFFLALLNAPHCEKICVENPVPSKIYGLPQYSQIIQPYQFGHPVTKKTCLWIKGLENLKPTNDVGKPKIVYMTKRDGTLRANCWEMMSKGGKDRAKERSKTFLGIAKAMADQWG